MSDDKHWYEKISIWITIIAGIFGILGYSVFGGKSLINNRDTDTTTENASQSNTKESDENYTSSQHEENSNDNPEDNIVSNETETNSDDSVEESVPEDVIVPFITSQPKSDGVTCATWYDWTENDRDIIGNTYFSQTAMKVAIYNTINAMGGGSHDISADLHIPLGEKYSGSWKLNFVVAQEMIGNGSYADIKILSGEEELVSKFTIESTTTEEIIHEISLDGIRDLIIHFDCHAVDNGFWLGIICE